ncbi:hypothetical protein EVAR_45693_1 [Eumeta japonica]|uniref:Uncharacterized protein n=1 Tax=Eumeta variegata TaxID=151549 RepID=A0A4C1XK43_EUMVA|nr:hypothetical protein EVAR_45693_1 [Eumeta japonica]
MEPESRPNSACGQRSPGRFPKGQNILRVTRTLCKMRSRQERVASYTARTIKDNGRAGARPAASTHYHRVPFTSPFYLELEAECIMHPLHHMIYARRIAAELRVFERKNRIVFGNIVMTHPGSGGSCVANGGAAARSRGELAFLFFSDETQKVTRHTFYRR